MPHRSHLKQQNKPFKKVKRTKHKVRNKQIEKKKKRKEKRVKDVLDSRFNLFKEKIKKCKLEKQEKIKYIPFYDTLNICIVNFHESVDLLSFKKDFIKFLYLENEDDIEIDTIELYNIYTIHFNEKKKNKSLTIYDVPRTVYGIIDGTKCADIILCLFKDATLENSCFDEVGYELLSILKSQGIPSIIGVSYKNELENIKSSQKYVLRYFHSEFTEKDKLVFINDKKDFVKLYNEIWNTKLRSLRYRDGRGYMLVDSCAYNSEQNVVYVKGFVKGVGFNVGNPIHITNIGDYYIEDIFVLDVKVEEKKLLPEKKRKKPKEYLGNMKTSANRSNNMDMHGDILQNFLDFHKSSSINFQISYHPLHIQSRKAENCSEDADDDFNCIRPLDITNVNEQTHLTNLMTLQNKDESKEWSFSKNEHHSNFSESDAENSLDNYDNTYNESNRENNNGMYVYKPNINLENVQKNKKNTYRYKLEMNNDAFDSEKEKTKQSKWAFISEEKHEFNDNVICFFDKNKVDPLNDNNNNKISFEVTNEGCQKNAFHNLNDNENINEYGRNEIKKYSDEDSQEEDSCYSDESDNGSELCKDQDKTKSGDPDGNECFELDSVRSDRIYLRSNISAKDRFKRYRSILSFLNTPIDVYEDLPIAYSRIYDYESYFNLTKYSKNKYLTNCRFIDNRFSLTDSYCVLVISNDNKLFTMIHEKPVYAPLIISSLLPFERKVTVLNMKVKRNLSYENRINSKEEYEIVCGFRHFLSRPIFSEQYVKAVQSRGLYERHLKPGDNKVASVYGFTTVTRSSVFILKKADKIDTNVSDNNGASNIRTNELNNETGAKENMLLSIYCGNKSIMNNNAPLENFVPTSQQLLSPIIVAMGEVMNCDCKRIVMKRISITGRPYKIHKRKVVVRGMFYNAKDINYFKPVELQTRLGLSGKIKESLGTHGKMKCIFSNVLKAHDVIYMNLYKRVYPKWFPLSWNDNRNYGPDENVPEKELMPLCNSFALNNDGVKYMGPSLTGFLKNTIEC